MMSSGIRFPETLRSALRDGGLVVFAGAGVSMGTPACLPDFKTLADLITKGTGETRLDVETDDALLGRLHNAGVRVHDIAARLLQTNHCGNHPSPTALHHDLVRLYPEPDKVRIVTTNFDLLFDDAARDLFAEQPDVFKAPALPLGREFNGIVHVHGCLDRPQGMVLTDADFGRAYLTDGWASRFPRRAVSLNHRHVCRLQPPRHGHEVPRAGPAGERRGKTFHSHRRSRRQPMVGPGHRTRLLPQG